MTFLKIQVALRAVVLQPGGVSAGRRDWLVVGVLFCGKLQVQSGAGVESYSDASSRQVFMLEISDWLIFKK
jgi:hypothetical protein